VGVGVGVGGCVCVGGGGVWEQAAAADKDDQPALLSWVGCWTSCYDEW
jgi:hypothetical protein